MEPIITNTFPKQPREIRWIPISFAERLDAEGDTPRAVNPIELDAIPSGISLDAQEFDPATARLQLLISGGTDRERYVITMWLHTTTGQKLEHQITIAVKER